MSRLWRQVGTIKGASAGAERIFSLAGFILNARRNRLDSKSLKALTCQSQWYKNDLLDGL